jgi:hypothetical protein
MLAGALVVPPSSRVTNPDGFKFAEKQEYPPQYILGLLENGSFWFHQQRSYTVPRPMFTITNSDRKALDIVAGYLESGDIRPIEPGEYRLRFSGFEGCTKLRIFLEQNQPVNLAAQFKQWLGLWDLIVSRQGNGNDAIWQKVPEITDRLQVQNVEIKGKLPLEWIVGFLDGSIGRFLDARMDKNYLVARAQMHSVSKPLLDAIRETLGVGAVSPLKSNPGKFRYFVNRLDTERLVNALVEFPPIIRHERFILWKEIAQLARENNQPEGTQLVRAEALVETLNKNGVVRHNS